MVHYNRCHQLRKGDMLHIEDDEALSSVCPNSVNYYKRTRPKLLTVLFLCLLSCTLILATHLVCSSSACSPFYSYGPESEGFAVDVELNDSMCSPVSDGTVCCDRRSVRTDICLMKGDVRTQSASASIFVYASRNTKNFNDYAANIIRQNVELQHELIKPYTRKWEKTVMDTIDELHLVAQKEYSGTKHECDVKHDVPAVVFSTGGYTGNVYHEFNDGILPLYITVQHLNKKVQFVILEYHNWWITKYGDILRHLSDYPAIDFSGDSRTHCFPEAIAGLRIHDELTINPPLMKGNKSIIDFRNLLDRAYWPRIKGLMEEEKREAQEKLKLDVLSLAISSGAPSGMDKGMLETKVKRPKLVILSRKVSRAISNEDFLVKMAGEIGFEVEVLRPDQRTELAKIYRTLNSSEVMVGVHGAAMTHFLFMRPASVFIQVIPLGTEWAAETYYGEPAKKLGLKYVRYQILPRESSLYDNYDVKDPVLQDPSSVTRKGWQHTKATYLDSQNVTLNLRRFRKRLFFAYGYSFRKMDHKLHRQLH